MARCPTCFVFLTVVIKNDVRIKTCSSCFGDWVARAGLMHLVRAVSSPAPASAAGGAPAPANSTTVNLQDLAALASESDTKTPLSCPDCHVQLAIDRLHPMIPVNLQFCRKCDGVWLDVGKLPLVQRLFHELLTTTDPRLVQVREKLALAEMALEQRHERIETIRDRMSSPGSAAGGASGYTFGGSILFGLEELVDILTGRI
jgi:Zn-finger nucleic acid-binding protein